MEEICSCLLLGQLDHTLVAITLVELSNLHSRLRRCGNRDVLDLLRPRLHRSDREVSDLPSPRLGFRGRLLAKEGPLLPFVADCERRAGRPPPLSIFPADHGSCFSLDS